MKTQIAIVKSEDIDNIVKLARPIWYEHYSPIIGREQVEYMLDKFQSSEAISQQLSEGYQYYQVTNNSLLSGYFSIQYRDRSSLFISKFYLDKNNRGSGIGREMLSFIEQLGRSNHCKTLDLTVNKYNPAYDVYLKLGFDNVGSVEFDIGNNYIMDDYLMSKNIT